MTSHLRQKNSARQNARDSIFNSNLNEREDDGE